MKICSACHERFDRHDWACSSCGFSPPVVDDVVCLAPDLAKSEQGFRDECFAPLAELEEKNFWFRARNRLIQWVLARFFPGLRNFMEIGCGTGFVLSGVKKGAPGVDLHASELHLAGLEFATRRHPDVHFCQMDARDIPYEAEFDGIGAFDVLEHVEEDEQVLQQMYRAVNPGGGVILTVPQHPSLWSPADDYACHVRRYRPGELEKRLSKAGFRLVFSTSFVSLLFPLMLASRRKRGEEFDPLRELKIGGVINWAMGAVLDLERALIRMGVRFPFGGSRLVVARRPEEEG